MIGKTIAEVVDRSDDYGGIDILFTDGTAVRIEGDGYETSTVTQSPLTAEERAQEAREKEERIEAERLAAIARRVREAEEAEVKAALSPEDYEAWMDEHRAGWRYRLLVTRQIHETMHDMRRSINRQLYGDGREYVGALAVIPIAPSAHTTDHTEPPEPA